MLSRVTQSLCLSAFVIGLMYPSRTECTTSCIPLNISICTVEKKDFLISKESPIYKVEPVIHGKNIERDLENIKILAQLVQAEAGNQDLTGMRYVADVVLNRVDSEIFPDSIKEVIYQNGQFSVIKDGAFDRAYGNVSDNAYIAAEMEYYNRMNYDILYFSRAKSKYAKHHFKHQDHWFGW